MFKHSISFALVLLLSSGVFAATGTGHAQAELSTPLGVESVQDLSFGTVAIDPDGGPQTITMLSNGTRACPASYVCSGASSVARLRITGRPSTSAYVTTTGSSAVLSDGSGNTLTFVPDQTSSWGIYIDGSSAHTISLGGTIDFTGNEVAGVYSSRNSGGSGFLVTVAY